jgi:hypothetical protein
MARHTPDTPPAFRLRGEHLANLGQYLAGVRLKWNSARGYSDEFAAGHDAVLRGIVDNPDATVTVVAGMDDICHCSLCPRLREHCRSGELQETDRRAAGEYGVRIGRPYRSEALVAAVRAAAEAGA